MKSNVESLSLEEFAEHYALQKKNNSQSQYFTHRPSGNFQQAVFGNEDETQI